MPDCVSALSSLLDKSLVAVAPGGLTPASPFVAGPARQRLSAKATRQLHQRYADACRRRSREASPDLLALGHHLLHAGHLEQGTSALLEAPAVTVAALEIAAALLTPQAPAWRTVHRALARAARARGDVERALGIAEEVARHWPEDGHLLRAQLLLDVGRASEAQEALACLTTDLPPRRLLAARAFFLLGDYDGARAEATAGLGHAELTPVLKSQLSHLAGLSEVYSGRLQRGLALLQSAEELAQNCGDEEALARVLNSTGIALQRLGRLAEAAGTYQRCLDLTQRMGDLRLAASCTLNLGTLAQREKDFAAALAHYHQARSLAERGGIGVTRAWALANEGNLLLFLNDPAGARQLLLLAEQSAREVGASAVLAHANLFLAELELSLGRLDDAALWLEKARACLGPSDSPESEAADLVACTLRLQHGEPSEVVVLTEKLLGRMLWNDPDRWKVHLAAARAALAGQPPAHAEATRHLELGLALTGSSEQEAWELHGLLSHCHQQMGRTEAAAHHALQLGQALSRLRERIPPPYREAFDLREDVKRCRELVPLLPCTEAPEGPNRIGLERLLQINKDLHHALPVTALLERILECAIELTSAERGFALLTECGAIRLVASRNVDGDSVRRGLEKISQSVALRAIAENRAIIATDAMEDSRFREKLSVQGLQLRAVLCVPLQTGDGLSGALYVDNRFRTGAFHRGHLRLMEAFADQAAIALEMARLSEEGQKQRRELEVAKAEVEALNQELAARVASQSEELGHIEVRLRNQEEELVRRYTGASIVGRSKGMRKLFLRLDRIAEADVPVVIWGESGTGKELVARAIHGTSARREQPFVAVNCGAVPAALLESELFGHVRGAFTGATRDRPGLFEVAGAGTLLLDEIGDMPPEMQVELLRVLQDGTFLRLGDEKERKARCRVLSASHRRLEDLVAQGSFREDLFYRLNVVQVQVPPLRERREDIPLLVAHILSKGPTTISVTPEAMAMLVDHDWPGNIRQLENEPARASLLSDGVIGPTVLSIPSRRARRLKTRSTGLQDAVRDVERQAIQSALEDSRGNISAAAKRLGLHRVVLYRKMKTLGIRRPAKPA